MEVVGGSAIRSDHELARLLRDSRAAAYHPASDALAHEAIGKGRPRHRPGGPTMVTVAPSRPSADPRRDATSGHRSGRPDGVFARPEILAAKAAGTGWQRRRDRRRSQGSVWLGHLVELLRLPPPLVDRSQPPTQTRPDTAAAIGVWMRRRDDPNP